MMHYGMSGVLLGSKADAIQAYILAGNVLKAIDALRAANPGAYAQSQIASSIDERVKQFWAEWEKVQGYGENTTRWMLYENNAKRFKTDFDSALATLQAVIAGTQASIPKLPPGPTPGMDPMTIGLALGGAAILALLIYQATSKSTPVAGLRRRSRRR